jgi:23S rRNA (guanosine2251-2'-O)-methyltransferase
VTDPRNLGAIVRSAAAFGAHGVVVPARRGAGVTAGAWKASAGALARLPVARAANLARALQSYRDAGVFVAGLDAAGEVTIRDLDLATAPLVLVTGSEGRGLSRIVAQTCDVLVRIPIAASTESLNAGVATGIALYEVASVRSRLRLRCLAEGTPARLSLPGRLLRIPPPAGLPGMRSAWRVSWTAGGPPGSAASI